MEIVILLIPLALIFLGGAIAFLFWALRKDQFEDLDNASWRVVFDDREQRRKPPSSPSEKPVTEKSQNDEP
ncbi:cbb3-type cytochrome oxidase maturation protein [Alcanivorax nanhaiticus]|uniref:Cbb3-type cytochrome oxidase maturation protein n=1 Tax=Alcanivorax nanhaiticus TaxID=1177154 RepID=A0A095SN95_9GAMM|nr:cbb3-type cytochrome oxidase assembly protein CcoS [Alcanivorax nanhaiticus]KGD65824.1 cbb3-type cytochrome oxidase maturation protein [Alcanivorax nanhaiticus]